MRQTEACRAELVHRRAWLGGETAASGRAGVAAARGGVTTLLPGWANVTQVLRVLVYNSTSLSCTHWTDNIVHCVCVCVCVCVLSIKSFRSFYLWKCKFCWLKKQVNYNIIISNYVVKYTIDDQKEKGINEQ